MISVPTEKGKTMAEMIDRNELVATCRATLMKDVFSNWINMPNNEKNVAIKLGGIFKRIHDNVPTIDIVLCDECAKHGYCIIEERLVTAKAKNRYCGLGERDDK